MSLGLMNMYARLRRAMSVINYLIPCTIGLKRNIALDADKMIKTPPPTPEQLQILKANLSNLLRWYCMEDDCEAYICNNIMEHKGRWDTISSGQTQQGHTAPYRLHKEEDKVCEKCGIPTDDNFTHVSLKEHVGPSYSELIQISDTVRLYIYYRKDEDNYIIGFYFKALLVSGCRPAKKMPDDWYDENESIEVLYSGHVSWDGIRHLYMGSEETKNDGYIYYPNLDDHIKIFTEIKRLCSEHGLED